jgi:phosphoribosylamine--glycine ligase
MNTQSFLVIGSGGREHALAWHLRRFYPGAAMLCAPGNPGIGRDATCVPIQATDLAALVEAAREHHAYTVVGPEAPLVAGIADAFQAAGLPIFGPTAAAAALEGSKAFAKAFMRRWGIPTARAETFTDLQAARAYIARHDGPIVIKADGLAAGKGVAVCDDAGAAVDAARAMLIDRAFGDAGARIVVEERLSGDEMSVFALVHDEHVVLLPAAQDHKRAYDGDRGPNTGGMGAVAPYPLNAHLRDRILRDIIQPVASGMCREGRPYRGVLFAGLMLTSEGPKVLEFNCRFGDPEAQVIIPMLPVGLPEVADTLSHGAAGGLLASEAGGVESTAVGVVLASDGYPGPITTGHRIDGVDDAARDALVFHNGTAYRDRRLVTAGGRVLTVVGQGPTVAAARNRAYQAVERIHFTGATYRRDIGARLLGREAKDALTAVPSAIPSAVGAPDAVGAPHGGGA